MFTFFVILISLLFSFFFSGLEIAYVSANKLQIHVESQKESLSGRIFARITHSPVRFLTTLLLGNTLAIVVFSIFTADVIESMLSPYIHSRFEILIIQTAIPTIVILVVADFIPKNLFRFNPNKVLQLFALPSMIMFYLLLPLTAIVLNIAHFVMKQVFHINLFRFQSTFTKTDLHDYIDEHTTTTTGKQEVEHEVQIFRNALSFPDVKVRDCMVPRVDAITMDINDGIVKIKEKFQQTGLSRILVYNANMDNVLGYIHYHEMFKQPEDIRTIVLPAPVVPESMPAKDALRIFMQQHKSMGVVVDEFGVTSGILTSEDVIEKIFGKIDDEYDNEELPEKQISPNEYVLSARLDIDYLNQKYNLNLPDLADYKTLGGLILHNTGSIPKTGETIAIGDFQMKIISSSANRIEQVNLTVKKEG
ncbi:MAG TPA: hemolysin family protein [Bacteroidia bacterium]|jgi:putative hemolysin|nr:hemolysin family protein [Bacteroidia bacterium]